MTGNWAYKAPHEPFSKHAHLRFEAKDGSALCFVDPRRFGSWQVTESWGSDEERGPDILLEYHDFVANIAKSLDNPAFDKAICVVMLDQRFFNGVGNYLRAEILFVAAVWSC